MITLPNPAPSVVPRRSFRSTLCGRPAGNRYSPGSGGTLAAHGSSGYCFAGALGIDGAPARAFGAPGPADTTGAGAYGCTGSRRNLTTLSLTPDFFNSSNSSVLRSKALPLFLILVMISSSENPVFESL